jgi:hypothetical protein
MSIDFDPNVFYVHVDYGLGALPTSVVALKLHKPIDPAILPYTRAEQHRKLLDKLHDEGCFSYYHDYVYPQKINVRGYKKVCRLAVEVVIPTLSLMTKTMPTRIYSAPYTPTSTNYPTTYLVPKLISGLRIARLIGWYNRLYDAQTKWDRLHPEYGWKNNGGGMTAPHAAACLQYGIIPYYHYNETLKTIPSMWIRSIKKKQDISLETRDYRSTPPEWWCRLFNNVHFFHFMSPEERHEAECLVDKRFPKSFYQGFLQHYAPKPSCTRMNTNSTYS